MVDLFHIEHLLRNQSAILDEIRGIRRIVTAMSTSTTLGFADMQAAVNQVVNDNTQQNNAIAAQLKEVQQMVLDFSQGDQAPTQAQYQGVIAQLAAVHSLVQSNTASLQASGSAIASADPNAGASGSGSTTPPADTTSATGGTPSSTGGLSTGAEGPVATPTGEHI